MSAGSSSPTWRTVLATVAAAGAFGLVLLAAPCDAQTATDKESTVVPGGTTTAAIRPFRVNVPEEALVDLRRRIAATRWPDKERPIRRRACRSPGCRSWSAIGAAATTGARRKRS